MPRLTAGRPALEPPSGDEDYFFHALETGVTAGNDTYRVGIWNDPQPKGNKNYRDNVGIYTGCDWMLHKENSESEDSRGFGMFFRYGYATVAGTVKLMCESGICRQVDFGDGSLRYEHKYGHEHHDHLICLKCGKFEEIHSPKLEKVQNELVKKYGYVQENHKLDIYWFVSQVRKKAYSKKVLTGKSVFLTS